MKKVLLVFGILLGIITLIFILQNQETVTYSFLPWSITTPRYLVFLSIFFIGLLLGWAVGVLNRRKRGKRRRN